MKTWYNVSEINRLPEELYNLHIADDGQLSSWAPSDISAQWFTHNVFFNYLYYN